MTSTSELFDQVRVLCRRLGERPIQIMEVCGTHTMSIARSGMRPMLPSNLTLLSGPGCPVCVTPQGYVDQALALTAGQYGPAPIIATYGDMVRVPGRHQSLADARATGATVEVVYCADQAVDLAKRTRDRDVVFLAVGFETTTPATALAVLRAQREGVNNFSVLTAHKVILPAMEALLSGGQTRVDGFLCPGHVSIMLGWGAFDPIAKRYAKPCVVAGFEPAQILAGVVGILEQLVEGCAEAASVYPAVRREGNAAAAAIVGQVFEPGDSNWRAIGVIPGSGMILRGAFAQFDAKVRYALAQPEDYETVGCRCGEVITGRCRPGECGLFGKACTVVNPIGPCMVSSEGACAAAYKYERGQDRG